MQSGPLTGSLCWLPAADRNLKVWRLADGQCLLTLHQKVFIKDAWPTVQFNAGACGRGGGRAIK